MKRAITACALLALLVSACAGATSRTARPLEVRYSGVDVLGCVPLDEGETVEIDAAGVSPITVEGREIRKPWGIVLDDGRAPHVLAPGDCLAFGHLPEGYSEVIAPATLESEWPYSFAIRSPEWGRHRTRNYAVDFCVRHSDEGMLAVIVPEGPAAITVDVCRQLLDSADDEARLGRGENGS